MLMLSVWFKLKRHQVLKLLLELKRQEKEATLPWETTEVEGAFFECWMHGYVIN
jgi:hypothetical protein